MAVTDKVLLVADAENIQCIHRPTSIPASFSRSPWLANSWSSSSSSRNVCVGMCKYVCVCEWRKKSEREREREFVRVRVCEWVRQRERQIRVHRVSWLRRMKNLIVTCLHHSLSPLRTNRKWLIGITYIREMKHQLQHEWSVIHIH